MRRARLSPSLDERKVRWTTERRKSKTTNVEGRVASSDQRNGGGNDDPEGVKEWAIPATGTGTKEKNVVEMGGGEVQEKRRNGWGGRKGGKKGTKKVEKEHEM